MAVKIGPKGAKIKALVYPAQQGAREGGVQMVLGNDWLRAVRCGMDFASNQLMFADGSTCGMADLPPGSQYLPACSFGPADLRTCGNCGTEFPGLLACGLCKKEWYCDQDCQAQHWTLHKVSCEGRSAQGLPDDAPPPELTSD